MRLSGLLAALPLSIILAAVAQCDLAGEARGGGAALPCTYFVAEAGSDRNNGRSAATPFATLEKAQSTVRRDASKVVCLRAGTYHRTAPLRFTSSDDGETWQYDPASGVDTAVLDGGNTVDLISINGASNLTINGLSLQHSFDNAIATEDDWRAPRINNLTIENCDIGFNQHTGAQGSFNPLVFIANATNTRILNNYVHDAASQGIGLYAFYARHSIDGSVIGGNVVLRTVERMSDGGSIYINMRGTGESGGHVTVTNNFVRDYGALGITGAAGIYLDDNASYVTVSGNVVGPPTSGSVGTGNLGAVAFEIHNGNHNAVSGNILDLGDSGRSWAAIWYQDSATVAGMSGNTFTGNVVISGFFGNQNTNFTGRTGYTYFENAAAAFKIENNLYYNYAGGHVRTDGPITSDSNPIFADPQIGGWTYHVADDSPAFRWPVNFPRIVGGWGPPGFVIPQDGTAPSPLGPSPRVPHGGRH
jgi:hypothetical protein